MTFNLSCIQKLKTIYPLEVYAINQDNLSNLSVYCSLTRSDSCHSSPVSTKNFYPRVFTTSCLLKWNICRLTKTTSGKLKTLIKTNKNPNKCTENEAGLHYKSSSTMWHQDAYLWVENEGYRDCCKSIKMKNGCLNGLNRVNELCSLQNLYCGDVLPLVHIVDVCVCLFVYFHDLWGYKFV